MTTASSSVVRHESALPTERVGVAPSPAIYELKSPIAGILTSAEARAEIAPYLRHGVDLDTVIVEAFHAVAKNPDILKCTQTSIISAVSQCVAVDLVIGRTIHLVPLNVKISRPNEKPERFEYRLNAWTDFKGDIELVVRSGAARHVDAKCIYKNEPFEHEQGSNPFVRHRPILDEHARGQLIGAYCIAYITQTLVKITVMSLGEIEAIRRKSRSWSPDKVKDCPPWYATKTTVHANTKSLPKNPRLARVLALFERQDAIEHDAEELPAGLRVNHADEEPGVTEWPSGAASAATAHADPDPRRGASSSERPFPTAATSQEVAAAEPAAVSGNALIPECPVCAGPMTDCRPMKAAGTHKPNAPDWRCAKGRACEGKYWPGQWPPKEEDSSEDPRQEDMQF